MSSPTCADTSPDTPDARRPAGDAPPDEHPSPAAPAESASAIAAEAEFAFPVASSVDFDVVGDPGEPIVRLQRWAGPWPDDDKDANFKHDVALHAPLDPLHTLRGLSASVDIPVGALARYVLTRYATGGSGGLLEIGPSMVHRLWAPIEEAETAGDDGARLAAYHQVRQMISWLKAPLDRPEYYGDPAVDRETGGGT